MTEEIANLITQLEKGHYYARSTAARLLGDQHDPRARDALIGVLTDSDAWVVEHAAEALGQQGDPVAVPALALLLEHKNYQVRTAAAAALGCMGNADALPALKAHADDTDSWVREAVESAIAALEATTSAPSAAPAATPTASPAAASAPPSTPRPAAAAPPSTPPPAAPTGVATVDAADALVKQAAVGTNAQHKRLKDGSHLLRLRLPGGRTQKVRVIVDEQSSQGVGRIRCITVLGPATRQHFAWALRQNLRITRGALGIIRLQGHDFFALTETMLYADANLECLIAVIERLARRGDRLERMLGETDGDTW